MVALILTNVLFCFFLLVEELDKAKMQSYRSVEQLEALSGRSNNKERF